MEVIIEKIITGVGSYALEEFNLLCNLKDDFQKMKDTVSAINAVLLDAEAKAMDCQIKDWLLKLGDVLYDADDLLDEFSFEDLRREVMTRNHMAKKVRIFFSESNQAFFSFKMGYKMKEIRKRLDDISDIKNKFQLLRTYSPRTPSEYKEWRETYSFIREYEIIGREEEKENIVSDLLKSDVDDVVSVVPIVGFGGLGKTVLAQFVYNDKNISQHFEVKMWVRVSNDFRVKSIAQKMLRHTTNDGQIGLEELQEKLRSEIKEKRFLLVLDDVWNEDRLLWLELERLLMEGAKGSKIIVTTRSMNVAKIMGTLPPILLKGLDNERSWKLFCQMAFKNGEEPNNSEMVAIGKDIVRKCVGVPLAIRAIGSLLSANLDKSAWLEIRDMELSKIEEEEKRILSILKLSYDYLPLQLRKCFAYCSLFPKDYTFVRKTLIQLWIAQGFIQQLDKTRSEEDIGHDYFMSLLSRSFFQDVEMNEYGEIWWCKVHDLMHDLASFVAGDEHIVVRKGKEVNIDDRARHLSFDSKISNRKEIPASLFKANKLRTFLLPCQYYSDPLEKSSLLHSLTSNMKCSRVLDFHYFEVKEIPKSVGKLKHLRYLDLSHSDIKMLPQGITNLHMLQTLKLNYCEDLEVLPRDINKLVSLRHLELEKTDSLRFMPSGLGQLTCLQLLTDFVVSKDEGARISELDVLKNLSGPLSIRGLKHVRGDTSEVESAELLSKKQYLQELNLCWSDSDANTKRDELEKVACKDEMVLNALQPHPSIKKLKIDGFCGKSLPEWIGNLSSLRRLYIWKCHGLEWLPESISNLLEMQYLSIGHCSDLKSLPKSMGNLTSLQNLHVWNCGGLTSLSESMGNLSSLQKLYIRNCGGLTSLPDGMQNLNNLKEFHMYDCPQLIERCKKEEGEDWPKIAHIPRVIFQEAQGKICTPEQWMKKTGLSMVLY